jgi:hypothetical protein
LREPADAAVPSVVPVDNSDELTSAITPAPHLERTDCQCLSSLDANLQSVIAAWDELPAAIRNAIVALACSQG